MATMYLDLTQVFTWSSPPYLAALQSIGDKHFNKFIIHADNKIISFSLELVARCASGKPDSRLLGVLNASKEIVTGADQNVLFARHVIIHGRVLREFSIL